MRRAWLAIPLVAMAGCGGTDPADVEQQIRDEVGAGDTRVLDVACSDGRCAVRVAYGPPAKSGPAREALSDRLAECHRTADDPMVDCFDLAAEIDEKPWVQRAVVTYDDDGNLDWQDAGFE